MKRKLLLQLTLLAFAISGSLHVLGQISGQYQQDFEGPFPPSGWQVKNVLDLPYAWVKTTALHHSGTHSAYIHYSSDASIQAEDWLILPKFTVAATDSFSFWLAAQYIGYLPDSTSILVSTTDSNLSSFTNVVAILSEPNNYPDSANIFRYHSYSLGAYAGQNIFVALKNRNKDGDGLYVDLVTIGTPPPALSVAAISVDVPDSVSLIPFSPTGTVKNKSDATQTFPVTMTITGGYSSTMNVTNLDPGELQQITFDPWTPAAEVVTITMETQLATDTVPSDNIISKVVTGIDTDVAAASIDVPGYVSTLSYFTPKATVRNYSLTVESFSVTMNITGGYTSTKNVINLAPGARQQIDFDVWTPAGGDATVSIQTQLAGDVIPADDTLSKVVSAVPPMSGYYQEDFEGTFPPFGWQTLDVLDTSEVWVQNTDIPYSGIYDAYMSYSPQQVQGEDWLILPQWSVTADDSFSFWLAVQSIPYPPDSTEILISATDAYPSSFTDVLGTLSQGVNYPDATFTYEYYSFSLSAYAGQNIYVALRNRNIYGDGIYVDLTSIGTPLGTAISENTAVSNDLSSFPNPFTKFTSLSFSLDQASAVNISIVDVTGKEVTELCNKTFPAGTQQITWNASGYSAGVYFCKVIVNGNVTTQKLVKLN